MLKLYVGNLTFNTSEEEVKGVFEKVGPVQSVTIIKDKYSQHSKGFGFIEMINEEDAKKAIEQLNDTEFNGRNLRVSEAKPMKKREDGGGYNKRGGSYNSRGKGGGYR